MRKYRWRLLGAFVTLLVAERYSFPQFIGTCTVGRTPNRFGRAPGDVLAPTGSTNADQGWTNPKRASAEPYAFVLGSPTRRPMETAILRTP